jgi:hypothetical protein
MRPGDTCYGARVSVYFELTGRTLSVKLSRDSALTYRSSDSACHGIADPRYPTGKRDQSANPTGFECGVKTNRSNLAVNRTYLVGV